MNLVNMFEDGNDAANEITDNMFEATGLTFMGSPCTKDCSGHKAGYEWSEKRGGQTANSHSQSFNNGAAINANQHKPKTPPKAQQPKDAADRLRDKQAELVGPDKAKTLGLAEDYHGWQHNSASLKKMRDWRQAETGTDSRMFQGYKMKFTNDGMFIYKGGDLVYQQAGDFSNPTNNNIMTAKRRITRLIDKAKNMTEDLGDEFGQKELKHTIARARAKFPRAASDTEALIMYVQDQEQQDVRKLDQVNDREDREIEKLDKEEDSIERRLQNIEKQLSITTETRLYYTVVGTVDKDLRAKFSLRKDATGWYLKESTDAKKKFQAYKAFGSPKLKEYDLTANRGTANTMTGAENPVSPVGSVPRGQQKARR